MITILPGNNNNHRSRQPLWLRVVLLSVLAYEALGCLSGGMLLILEPDGRLMKMPVSLMHGVFPDFLVPGIFLTCLGMLHTIAFLSVLHKTPKDWLMASLAIGGLAVWFWVEIAILLELHWLHAMWGLPVVLGGIAAVPLIPRSTLRKMMLICGIASSVLYIAINIIVPARWPEYNWITQTVSELSAVGAPTRMLWLVLCMPYTLLVIVFAFGVRMYAAANRRLKIAGNLLIVYGVLGLLWPFAPMHLRETLAAGGHSFSDTLHLILGAVTELLYFFALGMAAGALGKGFRIYSVITLATLMFFGVLTFMEAPNVALNRPTPLIGVWERINIGVFLVWIIVLAVILLRDKNGSIRQE